MITTTGLAEAEDHKPTLTKQEARKVPKAVTEPFLSILKTFEVQRL